MGTRGVRWITGTLLVGLAGCGDGGDEKAPTTAGAANPSAAAAPSAAAGTASPVSETAAWIAAGLRPSPSPAHDAGVALLVTGPKDAAEWDEALALLEQAVLDHPDDRRLAVDLADAYAAVGAQETLTLAAEIYDTLLTDDAGDDRLRARLADVTLRLGDFETALAHAIRRTENPVSDAAAAATQTAWIALLGRRPADAVEPLRRLVAAGRGGADARAFLALVLGEAGRKDEARAAAADFLAAVPAGSPDRSVAEALAAKVGR